MKIPRTMSTQHPDNVRQPFFANNSVMAGDDEIKEAFYAFSHLGIKEQLWDCEGKEADSFVVEKLLTRYEDFFEENRPGRDNFLTLRVPNPRVEKNQSKVLIETLESIPRNVDIATQFYGEEHVPIFEVSVPMTSSSSEILRVKDYYDRFIAKRGEMQVHDTTVREWLGDFRPDSINIIPLIEDKESMLNAHNIVKEYAQKVKQDYYRIWFARSDPALNYGNLTAVLTNKVALQRLHDMGEEESVDTYPMIGCGTAPFRGNFRPDNVSNGLKGYPSMHTFTLQSAYKYDFPESVVRDSVEKLESTRAKEPTVIDEDVAVRLINKVAEGYQSQIVDVAPLVNRMSSFIPQRRKRRLHIGLFGYSREAGSVSLPRAIKFTASLYSVGLPPELLGLHALSEQEMDTARDMYSSLDEDMDYAMKFYNEDNLSLLPDKVAQQIKRVAGLFDADEDEEHRQITTKIAQDLSKNNVSNIQEKVERAAAIRKFLG